MLGIRTDFVVTISLCLYSLLPSQAIAAAQNPAAVNRFALDANDIGASLFNHEGDPFSEEDRWSALLDPQRVAWTRANMQLNFTDGIGDVLRATKRMKEANIQLHIEVQLVAPDGFLTLRDRDRIKHYSSAMGAGSNGTSVTFHVSVAPPSLYKRLSMHSPSQDPTSFMGMLQQTAVIIGSMHVMYVIVNHGHDPINDFSPRTPFVGNERTSWMLYHVEGPRSLNIADLLFAIEKAAERVYAPQPLYFPIPIIQDLRFEVFAHTPGHEHKALWLDRFDWSRFESLMRRIAVPGQKLGFFLSPANSECPLCVKAFKSIDRPSRDSLRKAARALNNDVIPNAAWADDAGHRSGRKKHTSASFSLYVVDIVNIRKREALQLIERHPVSQFPGLGIVVLRSSHEHIVGILDRLFMQAFLAGVYGIAEPQLYVSSEIRGSVGESAPSVIASDIAVRYMVRSVVDKRILEIDEIIEGILYFDVDPTKSLGDREYASFTQRINLILYKLRRAQEILSDSNDGEAALYLVTSTGHDIKAIRSAFDIGPRNPFERFRDPTLRCHFSRLKREALKASEIIESTYPSLALLTAGILTFIASTMLSHFLLWKQFLWKNRGKRE